MTSDDYIFNALDTVRISLLNNGTVIGLVWPYDNNEQLLEQDTALDFLVSTDVISVDTQDSIFDFENGDFVFKGVSTVAQQENWKRTVTAFNSTAYEHMCDKYGLNPYKLTYNASLELKDDVVPVVSIGSVNYTLPTLHSGKASEIIKYCNNRINQTVKKEELKKEIHSLREISNVRDILRDSPFSHRRGALHPFVELSSHAITLHNHTQLTSEQLELIIGRAS